MENIAIYFIIVSVSVSLMVLSNMLFKKGYRFLGNFLLAAFASILASFYAIMIFAAIFALFGLFFMISGLLIYSPVSDEVYRTYKRISMSFYILTVINFGLLFII